VRHRPSDILFREGRGRARVVFCPIRYRLSRRLPAIRAELPARRVHQTSQQRNYVYAMSLAFEASEHLVFFMLQRAAPADGADLRLTVESAYASDGSVFKKRPRAIRFVILAHKVLTGQAVRFAPR